MKIAVNTRLLLPGRLEGIGWFTYQTLKRICEQHPEHDFYFLFDRGYDPSFVFSANVHPMVVHPMARHPLLYYFWFNIRLPRVLKRINPDLFLSTDGYVPLPYKGKILDVIHDLNFEHHPKDFPLQERWFYRHFFPKYARRAERIATVSEYSRQDIIGAYHIPAGNIDVVYSAVNNACGPLDEEGQRGVRQKFTVGLPYFLFVGSLHPRKNLARLFQAYDLFCGSSPTDTRLLIVGARKWWRGPISEAYDAMKHKEKVIFTGRVSVEDMKGIMASALALVFVSYFEGFGVPIVEAFASHTPVITANVTSMPEIAGDAALLADPFSAESICQAMIQLSQEPELRKLLISKGKDRLQLYSWQKTADLLWQSMMKCIETPENP